MFAKQLRAEGMINPLSPYTQQSKDQEKFTEIVQNLKVRIASELYEVEQLPAKEREKRVYKLQELKEGLNRVNKVEDLLDTVDSMARSLGSAINTYKKIMELPENERATLENMSEIYKLKSELDALDVMKAIEVVMLDKEETGTITDQGSFDKLEAKVTAILKSAKLYNS